MTSMRDEGDDGGSKDLATLREQNTELKKSLDKLEQEFPYLKNNLRKVNNLMIITQH